MIEPRYYSISIPIHKAICLANVYLYIYETQNGISVFHVYVSFKSVNRHV